MGIVGMVVCCMFGCSSFNREWDRAAERPGGGMEGAWAGRWESDAGHGGGALKCLLTKVAEEQLQARFYATYWAICRFHTTVILGAKSEGSKVILSGKEDLGWLRGGVYEYEGLVSSNEFSCEYRSKHDMGRFVMKRPGSEGKK